MTTYKKFKHELRKQGLYGDYSPEAIVILYGDYVINHDINNIIDKYFEYITVFEFIEDLYVHNYLKNKINKIREQLTKIEFTEDNIQPILDELKDTKFEEIYFLEDSGHVLTKKY